MIYMDFNCQKNFKKRNLTIHVRNSTGLYDNEGNLIHEMDSIFEIKNYIRYQSKQKKMIKMLAVFCIFPYTSNLI